MGNPKVTILSYIYIIFHCNRVFWKWRETILLIWDSKLPWALVWKNVYIYFQRGSNSTFIYEWDGWILKDLVGEFVFYTYVSLFSCCPSQYFASNWTHQPLSVNPMNCYSCLQEMVGWNLIQLYMWRLKSTLLFLFVFHMCSIQS